MMRLLIALLIGSLFCSSAQAQVGANTTYPPSSIAITGVFSGADTSSAVATLLGTSGRSTYICGFAVSGLGLTTGAAVNVAVASLAGGTTANFQLVFPTGVTTAVTPLQQTFTPCLPASVVGNNLTITVPGGAGNTSVNIAAWGYQF
jgi:hypothetical protein